MQKKVKIIDIAKMAGVSKGTVDRVLHSRRNVTEADP
jgi:LacI family transcriptional regulator